MLEMVVEFLGGRGIPLSAPKGRMKRGRSSRGRQVVPMMMMMMMMMMTGASQEER